MVSRNLAGVASALLIFTQPNATSNLQPPARSGNRDELSRLHSDQPAAEAGGGTVVAVVTIGSEGDLGPACGLVKPSWLRSMT